MRVLVLGATGFIGGRLADKLKSLGHEVLEWGSRRRDEDLTRQPYPYFNVEMVFNCVGEPRMYYCEENPGESLASNVLTTINAVQGALRHTKGAEPVLPPFFVQLSSCCINDETIYGKHKTLAEWHVWHSDLESGFVRPGSVYGPGAKKGPVLDAWACACDGRSLRFGQQFDAMVRISFIGDVVDELVSWLSPDHDSPRMIPVEISLGELVSRFRHDSPRDALDEKLFTVKQ